MLVIRNDNHYDYVNDFMADSLINSKQIVKFKRNTKWVNVEESGTKSKKQDKVFNGNNDERLAINDSIFVRAELIADK
jgi:hypothetical protein